MIQVKIPPLLQIENLHVSFFNQGQWFHVVKGISIALQQKQGIAIIGESGSGKTLTMLSTLGLVSGYPGVVDGRVVYQDAEQKVALLEEVQNLFQNRAEWKLKSRGQVERWKHSYQKKSQLLAGNKIGIIFQNPIASLDPLWSVGSTLIESILLRDSSLCRKQIYEEAVEWLHRVHIKKPKTVMNSYPHQLSGGMCQRVMIASTLAMHPKIIIADEPTTGLDMTSKAQIVSLLFEAREKYGSSLIFVTHEIGLVTDLTEEVYVMHQGKIVDYFETQKLSQIRIHQDKIELPDDFADYTKDLLNHSLKLEFQNHFFSRRGGK